MKRTTLLFTAWMLLGMGGMAQTTLEQCQQAARENYPLIKRYDLIGRTTALTVSNIAKHGWLPQIEGYGQGTLQSDVATLPGALTQMMSQMGYEAKGLSKGQYRVGVNVSQNLYDGGAVSAQKEMAYRQGEVESVQADVDLYKVRQRVNDLYFSILLTDERIQLARDLSALLKSNEEQLGKLLKGGVAMEYDYNSVRAERLGADRQLTELQAIRRQLQQVLSAFTGLQVGELEKPSTGEMPHGGSTQNLRPELLLVDRQLALADAQEKWIRSGLLPKVGAFAQGYYGYPGLDMFHDMFHRSPTLNGLIGLKVSWNLSNFFTRKNDLAKIGMQRLQAENQREIFLFNNRLEQIQQSAEMEKYRQLMTEDQQIVDLRTKARKSGESKLRHGIINVNDLLQDITRENAAKTELSTHEIQWLKAVYDLKYTVNY